MAKNTLLGIWVDADLKKQVENYAKEHAMSTSELGRLLFAGVILEKSA
jgi:antitoxin component of RelBE/YafQ-DinJ toxin-antitoxin module